MKINITSKFIKRHSILMGSYFGLSIIVFFIELYLRLNNIDDSPVQSWINYHNKWYAALFIFWISSSVIIMAINIKMSNQLFAAKLIELSALRKQSLKDFEELIHDNAEKKSVNINYTVEPINNNGTKPNKTTHKPKDYNN